MNLRILKKLSKRAAPLLPLLGDIRPQFPALPGENYMSTLVRARKHFERGRSVHADVLGEGEIKRRARDGRGWVYARPPVHPRAGTVMLGSSEGYEAPEWSEETAWCALSALVFAHYTDWDSAFARGEWPARMLRDLSTPARIFRAAHDLIDGRFPTSLATAERQYIAQQCAKAQASPPHDAAEPREPANSRAST